MIFRNREEAGQRLSEHLAELQTQRAFSNPIVLALPRGGVPVGAVVARALDCPLEVFVVRKIGHPEDPEYGIGAISETGFYRFSPEVGKSILLPDSMITELLKTELDEARRRARVYRGSRKLPDFRGRSVILVDDGIATGVTAKVAAENLRRAGASEVLIAVPVGAQSSVKALRQSGERVLCPQEPENFSSVGMWYQDFEQLSDEDVIDGLRPSAPHSPDLHLPSRARGVVVFAHGSGSSRMSPRNRAVARTLEKQGFGTLLFDLLSEDEADDRKRVFDIPLLAERLLSATRWLRGELRSRGLESLPIGYFGASTGAAAALWAAADPENEIAAVVSRGGRPDLATGRLQSVRSPTLLIVGGNDEAVLELNRSALRDLIGGELVVIPGATHLFEEPGALEAVSRHAARWFSDHFPSAGRPSGKVA